jgi:transposase
MRLRELSDYEWEIIRPFLTPRFRVGWPRADDRIVLNGILYVLTTGCRWMDMPLEFGSYRTARRRLRRWQDEGVWYEASINIQSPNNNSTNNHTPKIRNLEMSS